MCISLPIAGYSRLPLGFVGGRQVVIARLVSGADNVGPATWDALGLLGHWRPPKDLTTSGHQSESANSANSINASLAFADVDIFVPIHHAESLLPTWSFAWEMSGLAFLSTEHGGHGPVISSPRSFRRPSPKIEISRGFLTRLIDCSASSLPPFSRHTLRQISSTLPSTPNTF